MPVCRYKEASTDDSSTNPPENCAVLTRGTDIYAGNMKAVVFRCAGYLNVRLKLVKNLTTQFSRLEYYRILDTKVLTREMH